ncbi:hypothetical protein DIZ81_02345 [Legionella taurinensis]|uniref:Uncharacterized protein n=1 Tax=Legionella taurinensis TaxID=70611 RepID=A0A3A5L323_9GAMM|nr:hypothetical protein [Legionella taurinensis]MDX1836287.1 hypothetical protein [Legionella taurinensis]PUT41956.1 hypothetical protein DB744_02350 [Legionella taurinensis]PUT44745.1 hypothetical protein DB746_02350 [Legionella taurinensis]PUT48065.1 hypothetical protein DB743_00510 [Legionella taurinensis]PUT48880.1 hypothetical protein DB745_02350 [Legionella taurinensis]
METLYQILGLIGAGLIIWYLFRTVKGRPDLFTSENFSKSFATMGLLALVLIAFVAFLVFMVRST